MHDFTLPAFNDGKRKGVRQEPSGTFQEARALTQSIRGGYEPF